MLSYDLCRQLKQAGFPQGKTPMVQQCVDGCRLEPGPRGKWRADLKGLPLESRMFGGPYEDFDCPTIEDLLSDLGEDFRQLVYLQGGYSDPEQRWFAYGKGDVSTIGHDPAEALAYLWLELHSRPTNPVSTASLPTS